MAQDPRHAIGSHLARLYAAPVPSLPLSLVELLARLAVTEAMADFDRRARLSKMPGTDA